MDSKRAVNSLEEWLALPEISFPTLSGEKGEGSVYPVHKVGFLAVPEDQCKKAGISTEAGPGGKCLLPTAVVEFAASPKLCRLPLALASWAFNCVTMAHSGKLSFPASVEFGILNRRIYAEFVQLHHG